MKSAAVILAAGASSRFGRPKQLLEIDGETLVSRACRVASEAGCAPVIVVLGAHADEIRRRGLPPGVRVVINDRWADGMGGSIARGVEAIEGAGAVVILLADQPGVEPAAIRRVTERLAEPGVSVVRCEQGGVLGPPVAFAAARFAELARLEGDEGGRLVAGRHPESLAVVRLPGRRWDLDDEPAWREFLRWREPAG